MEVRTMITTTTTTTRSLTTVSAHEQPQFILLRIDFLRTVYLFILAPDDGDLGTAGLMTMWTTNPTAVQGSSCEMAHPASVAKGNAWLKPYVTTNKRYCAVDDKLRASGMSCGTCYKITYTGQPATDPGRPGSAVIQVVDSGSAKEFDCFVDVFKEITGASTGVFPIYYKQVDCVETGPTVVVLEGNNVWYTKVLVVGGHTGVKAISMTIDGQRYNLQRNGGATWATSLTGRKGATTFSITYRDDTSAELLGCFGGSWPVAPSSQCTN
jgi:hypothetical protein